MSMSSMPDKLNQENLTRYLTLLIEKILEKRQDLKMTPQLKAELAKTLAKLMLTNGEFNHTSAIDKNPEFLHKLTLTIVVACKLGGNEKLLEDIKKIFREKNITEKYLKDTKELEKKLSPVEMRQLKLMLEKIQEMVDEMKRSNLIKTPKLKPGASRKELDEAEEEEKRLDPNSILLAVVSSRFTGGLTKTITNVIGNLFGIVDQNANNGFAPIDQNNKTVSAQGDPLGLRHAAEENYKEFWDAAVSGAKAEFMRPTLKIQ